MNFLNKMGKKVVFGLEIDLEKIEKIKDIYDKYKKSLNNKDCPKKQFCKYFICSCTKDD